MVEAGVGVGDDLHRTTISRPTLHQTLGGPPVTLSGLLVFAVAYVVAAVTGADSRARRLR